MIFVRRDYASIEISGSFSHVYVDTFLLKIMFHGGVGGVGWGCDNSEFSVRHLISVFISQKAASKWVEGTEKPLMCSTHTQELFVPDEIFLSSTIHSVTITLFIYVKIGNLIGRRTRITTCGSH